MSKESKLVEGREMFELCQEAESENRDTGKEDLRFAREGKQWPETIEKQRQRDGRPCLTINKMPAFGRQVVNDSRMNKPAIRVHPVDSFADPDTAEVLGDLIRNIEYVSNAAAAYDTAIESAVFNGFGYWRVTKDYAYDDSFDMDLGIKRVRNPFAVYGDPFSTEVDSSDWNDAFVVDRVSQDVFEREYKGKANTSFSDSDAWGGEPWLDSDTVLKAEWWHRKEVERKIYQFFDMRTQTLVSLSEEMINEKPEIQALIATGLLEFRRERLGKTYKVTQTIMSGADILEENDWSGRYIPIIPVYGDEFDIEGKVYRRSLIHDAIPAQQMFNYWRTSATELVALAPRTPFIGPAGFADKDPRWETANSENHPYLEYAGGTPPQRQPLDSGAAAGSLQEALNAADDMKAIMGLHDASLGARSNETSGRAIMARQREGDISTFHFIDNLSRAIRHTGCVLLDLIPSVYSAERIIRVRGEDGTDRAITVNKQTPKVSKDGQPETDKEGNPIMAVYDLTVGKYDVAVSSGPSFTTRREEAAYQMTEFVRAYPAAAPIIGDLLVKSLDWPGADEIAERLHNMIPPQALGEQAIPPQVQQQIQQGMQLIQQLQQKVAELEGSQAVEMAKVENDRADTIIKAYDAETKRMAAEDQRAGMMMPVEPPMNTNPSPTSNGVI
jgi:TolA-binding protein